MPSPPYNPHIDSLFRKPIFDFRRRSLARGTTLVLASFVTSLFLSNFPNNRPNLALILPAIVGSIGTAETVRCIQRRWSFYHAGVILCIYMDIMVVGLIFFFLLYPYLNWITVGH